MNAEEARKLIRHRFSEFQDTEWWHQSNEQTFQELFNILEPYMRPELAVSVLSTAFWTAADEYGG